MEITDFFQFERFISPILIKIVYWIGLFFIGLFTIAGIVGTSAVDRLLSSSDSSFSFGGAIVSIILGIMFALIWRVICEIWIVIFSINDRLGIIAAAPKEAASSDMRS